MLKACAPVLGIPVQPERSLRELSTTVQSALERLCEDALAETVSSEELTGLNFEEIAQWKDQMRNAANLLAQLSNVANDAHNLPEQVIQQGDQSHEPSTDL